MLSIDVQGRREHAQSMYLAPWRALADERHESAAVSILEGREYGDLHRPPSPCRTTLRPSPSPVLSVLPTLLTRLAPVAKGSARRADTSYTVTYATKLDRHHTGMRTMPISVIRA